jgi:hypothetical protein
VASRVDTAEATRDWALAELERARLKYKSEINGVNTTVASLEAQLQQSRYYLDNVCAAPGDRDQRFRLIATTDSGTPWGGGKKKSSKVSSHSTGLHLSGAHHKT